MMLWVRAMAMRVQMMTGWTMARTSDSEEQGLAEAGIGKGEHW